VANEDLKNLLELLKDLAASLTAIITFITALVNFIKLWQGDRRLVTRVLLGVSSGLLLLTDLYLASRYPNLRPWLFGGLGPSFSRWH
jgi:hypothetical protein